MIRLIYKYHKKNSLKSLVAYTKDAFHARDLMKENLAIRLD